MNAPPTPGPVLVVKLHYRLWLSPTLFPHAPLRCMTNSECLPLSEISAQFAVNVLGLIAVTQAFLSLLRQSQERIVLIGMSRPSGPLLPPPNPASPPCQSHPSSRPHPPAPPGF